MFQNPHLRKQLPFILITLLFMMIAFLDRLIPEGMFFDGVIYAALSRNIAIGKGTLWHPYFGHGSFFMDHPTLMFGIQALFFKVFGDHYTTEKIYSFVVWLISAWLVARLWKTIGREEEFRSGFWLPLLLWTLVPTVLWCYPNNMLESTMGIFDLAAVMLLYKAPEKSKQPILYLFTAAIFIFLASLTKGPVGLFPLAIPAIHWLAFRKTGLGKAILSNIFLFVFVTVFYIILWQFPAPKNYIATYLDFQLFSAVAGEREKVDSSLGHFTLLYYLLTELAIPAIFCVLIVTASRLLKIKTAITIPERRKAFFFLLVGLSASLPIMISIKQRTFYIVPAIPYYAIALALMTYPFLSGLIKRYAMPLKATRGLYLLLLLIAVASVPYLWRGIGKIGRDHDIVHDIKLIDDVVPARDTVGVCPDMIHDYLLRAYGERYMQLETRTRPDYKYLILNYDLCDQSYEDSAVSSGYERLDIGTWKYIVYRKNITP